MTNSRAASDDPSAPDADRGGWLTPRRDFLRHAGALALAISPLAALAAQDTSEGIAFADAADAGFV